MTNEPKISVHFDKTIYNPGDLLNAQIIIQAKETIYAKGIMIHLEGKERVEVLAKSFWGTQEFETTQKEGVIMLQHDWVNHQQIIFLFKNQRLKPGNYILDFPFQLPQELPNTFFISKRDIWAQISYALKASLYSSETLQPILSDQREFIVFNKVGLDSQNLKKKIVKEERVSQCCYLCFCLPCLWCYKLGQIKLESNIQKTSFQRFDKEESLVNFDIEVTNRTNSKGVITTRIKQEIEISDENGNKKTFKYYTEAGQMIEFGETADSGVSPKFDQTIRIPGLQPFKKSHLLELYQELKNQQFVRRFLEVKNQEILLNLNMPVEGMFIKNKISFNQECFLEHLLGPIMVGNRGPGKQLQSTLLINVPLQFYAETRYKRIKNISQFEYLRFKLPNRKIDEHDQIQEAEHENNIQSMQNGSEQDKLITFPGVFQTVTYQSPIKEIESSPKRNAVEINPIEGEDQVDHQTIGSQNFDRVAYDDIVSPGFSPSRKGTRMQSIIMPKIIEQNQSQLEEEEGPINKGDENQGEDDKKKKEEVQLDETIDQYEFYNKEEIHQ